MQPTATEVQSILAELPPLPADVSDWIVETGLDSADEPAIWVWAVLSNDQTDFDTRLRIRDVIFDVIRRRTRTPAWVYVSFKSKEEMSELN